MAGVNRFSPIIKGPRFNPLTFEEQQFAPLALRERSDMLSNQQDLLLAQMADITVPDVYEDQIAGEKLGFENDINNLAQRIDKEGPTLDLISEFRNVRNKYNKAVSATGNIGRAAGANANINAVKDQYFKFGLERDFDADDLNRNWQVELEKYKQGLPSDLNNFKGQLPDFDPDFAPQNVDLADEAIKLSKLVKAAKDSTEGSIDVRRSPTGQGFIIVNEKGQEQSNDKNVDALRSYLEHRVINEDGDINKVLRFKGIDPAEYMYQVDNLTDVMRANSTVKSEQYAGQIGTAARGSSGNNANTSSNAKLNKTTNGIPRLVGTNTVSQIKKSIEDIQKDPALTPEQKNTELHVRNQALRKRQALTNNPEFQKAINAQIADNKVLKEFGITSEADLQAFTADPENDVKPTNVVSGGFSGMNVGFAKTTDIGTSNAERAQAAFNEANSLVSNEFLIGSDLYTLGYFAESQKLRDVMGKGLQNSVVQAMAHEGNISVMAEDGNFEQVGPSNSTDRFNELMNAVSGAEKVTYTLNAIDSGSLGHAGALVFNAKVGTGDNSKNYSIAMDMVENSISKELLSTEGDLFQALDRQGRMVLTEMKDKIDYRSLATSVPASGIAEFNEGDTQNIKRHASKAYSSINITPRSKDDAVNKYLFTADPDANYSIVINPDQSYSNYKETTNNRGEKVSTPMTMDDLRKKFMVARYYKDNKYTKTVGDMEADPTWEQQYAVLFMRNLKATTLDFDSPTTSSPYYSNNSEYSRLVKEYFEYTNNNAFTDVEKDQKALETYAQIAPMKLSSRLVKHAF